MHPPVSTVRIHPRALIALVVTGGVVLCTQGCTTSSAVSDAPCAPAPLPALVKTEQTLWVKNLNLGDVDRNDVASDFAWKAVSYNLDGLCTTRQSPDACTASTTTSPRSDGSYSGSPETLGLDNQFASMVALLSSFTNPPLTSLGVREQPVILVTHADSSAELYLHPQGKAAIKVPLHGVRIDASKGLLGGVVLPKDMVAAGALAIEACPAGKDYKNLESVIASSVDIYADGSNHPGTCDALSVGIGFDSLEPYAGELPALLTQSCGE